MARIVNNFKVGVDQRHAQPTHARERLLTNPWHFTAVCGFARAHTLALIAAGRAAAGQLLDSDFITLVSESILSSLFKQSLAGIAHAATWPARLATGMLLAILT